MPHKPPVSPLSDITSPKNCMDVFRRAVKEQDRTLRLNLYKKIIYSGFTQHLEYKVMADIYYNLGCDYDDLACEAFNAASAEYDNYTLNQMESSNYWTYRRQFSGPFNVAKSHYHNASLYYQRANNDQPGSLFDEAILTTLDQIERLNDTRNDLLTKDKVIPKSGDMNHHEHGNKFFKRHLNKADFSGQSSEYEPPLTKIKH